MQCQFCKTNDATIHLTEITDGVRTEMHMCEQCAAEQGITVKSQMSINELLSNLLASQPEDDQMLGPAQKSLACPNCGFTLEQFRKEAVLGCPYDYEIFEKSLMPLIQKAHDGHVLHTGKVPSKTSRDSKKQTRLLKMRQQLDAAVKKEDYELAAQLRDKINRLDSSVQKNETD